MPSTSVQSSIRRHLTLGGSLVVLLFGGVGGWAATTSLSGAVIAQGVLVVANNVKQLQHPEGGVIESIKVAEGDRVAAGQTLIQLESTKARTNLQIILKRIDEMRAREARSLAEQDSKDTIVFPPELRMRASEADAAQAMAGEKLTFELRRKAREGRQAQLKEKAGELEQTILGLDDQVKASDQQLALIEEDLVGIYVLLQKKLVAKQRLSDLKRQKASIQGERGRLVAAVAEAKGRIAAVNLEMMQVDHDVRQEAARDLAEARGQISELVERRASAMDELDRAALKSPLDGIVHRLVVHTIGGVVKPNETVLQIVPIGEDLIVEAKIQPKDINDVHMGQRAMLRFSGVNQRTMPDIEGKVELVSADIDHDERTGQSFYSTRISVASEQMKRLEGLRAMPGMPVETFITTRDRTVLSFLTEPLTDQVSRAFREK